MNRKDAKSKPIKSQEVRIYVAGTCGAGKSTLIVLIAKALLKAGINPELRGFDHFNGMLGSKQDQKKCLKAVTKKTKVVIEERDVYKSMMSAGYIMASDGRKP